MKLKITRKELVNAICYQFNDLYRIRDVKNADAYNSGIYGWNYDVYFLGHNIAIVHGYSPIGLKLVDNDNLLRKLVEKAKTREEKLKVWELLESWCIVDYNYYQLKRDCLETYNKVISDIKEFVGE